MIESFQLANVASYDEAGINVNNLKEVNFFYGANGCGKTTASNYLTDTSKEFYTSCSVNWKDNQPLQTLVYNKAFRDKNFGSSDIAGVFTLGQATSEQVSEINAKTKERNDEITELTKHEKQLKAKESEQVELTSEFTEKCWSLYKEFGGDFKDALRGALNKKLFKDKIITYSAELKQEDKIPTYEALIAKANTLLGARPSVFPKLPEINADQLIRIETDEAWKSIVVGKADVDIAGLIDQLSIQDWVNQGRKYIEDEHCPFCQKATIDRSFKIQLEAYFDDSFNAKVLHIERIGAEYESLTNELLSRLLKVLTEERQNPKTKLKIDEFESHFNALESQINANLINFKGKVDKVSSAIDVIQTSESIKSLIQIIATANSEIQTHNQLANDFDNATNTFTTQVWQFLADKIKLDYKTFMKKNIGLDKAISSLSANIIKRKDKLESLKVELVSLSRNMTSVQPAVDDINRLLKAYGFLNFEIVPSPELDNHYVIQRQNGELALDTLSEGEVTFITFLYFVQLANGALTHDAVTESRVLIIDDPISSLDSNVLYIVSAIVKGLIRDVKDGAAIKQILLFTHNVYFHKEASYQNGRSNGCNKTHFWILRKANNVTSVHPFEQKNPIESSYELLWRELKDRTNCSGITIQNTMRRILENYFKILGKFSDEDIISKFETPQEQQVCQSLLHWINDGSHCLPDDLYIQAQDDAIELYIEVFKKVFYYSKHISHYNMMMGIEDTSDLTAEQGVAA
ncbi:AAA family ATPase [Aliiglaciecola sp. NS0011-25]|uniref:AAA family ATPase n=1 Tax=Aliiglaciecola sp. NS0011-25 TaxID=3127654 RepID=UPI00310C1B24